MKLKTNQKTFDLSCCPAHIRHNYNTTQQCSVGNGLQIIRTHQIIHNAEVRQGRRKENQYGHEQT